MTDDFPTPPLPEEIARIRVRESVNGLTRGAAAAGRPARRRRPGADWRAARPSGGGRGRRPRRRPCRGGRRRPARCPAPHRPPRPPGGRARPGRRRPGAARRRPPRPSRRRPRRPAPSPARRSSGGARAPRPPPGRPGRRVLRPCWALQRISTTGVGRIGGDGVRSPHRRRVQLGGRARSPTPSATRPAARSTSSPATPAAPASPPARSPSSFELHPNVARHHLEKLTGGGYLVVEIAKPTVDGPARAAGRPSKHYLRRPARRDARAPPQARRPPRRAARTRARRARSRRRPRRSPTRSASSTA